MTNIVTKHQEKVNYFSLDIVHRQQRLILELQVQSLLFLRFFLFFLDLLIDHKLPHVNLPLPVLANINLENDEGIQQAQFHFDSLLLFLLK